MKCPLLLKCLFFCFCFFSRPGFLFFFEIQEPLDVIFCRSKVRHLLLGFSVFPVSLLLPGKEFCVFFVQLSDSRKLLHAQLRKCLLRRFMKSDLFAVSFKEGFTVLSLPRCSSNADASIAFSSLLAQKITRFLCSSLLCFITYKIKIFWLLKCIYSFLHMTLTMQNQTIHKILKMFNKILIIYSDLKTNRNRKSEILTRAKHIGRDLEA